MDRLETVSTSSPQRPHPRNSIGSLGTVTRTNTRICAESIPGVEQSGSCPSSHINTASRSPPICKSMQPLQSTLPDAPKDFMSTRSTYPCLMARTKSSPPGIDGFDRPMDLVPQNAKPCPPPVTGPMQSLPET